MKDEKPVIEKFAGILMMSRTYAHMAHLKTSSYSKHIALNEFYDAGEDGTDITDLLDTFVETAQGKLGKLDIPYVDLKGDVEDPAEALESHVMMLENLGKKCEHRAISAVVDEVIGLYYVTLYKLKELD